MAQPTTTTMNNNKNRCNGVRTQSNSTLCSGRDSAKLVMLNSHTLSDRTTGEGDYNEVHVVDPQFGETPLNAVPKLPINFKLPPTSVLLKSAEYCGTLGLTVYDYYAREDKTVVSTIALIRHIALGLRFKQPFAQTSFIALGMSIFGSVSKGGVTPQSGEDSFHPSAWTDGLFDKGVAYVKKEMPKLVKRLLALIASSLVVPHMLGSSVKALKMVGIAVNKHHGSSMSVASDFVGTISSMVSSIVDYLFSSGPPDEVQRVLLESKRLREEFQTHRHGMSSSKRTSWSDSYIPVNQKLIRFYEEYFRTGEYHVVALVDRERELLTTAHIELMATRVTSVPVPLSLNIVGSPSIGKSSITNTILGIISNALYGCKYDKREIAYVSESKYFDQIGNQTKVLVADDIMAAVRAGEKSDSIKANIPQLLINAVNSTPFAPVMAEAHMKGKINLSLDAVIMTSNEANKYGGVDLMATPSAGARRMILVEVTLLPCHTQPAGGIDYSLSRESFFRDCPWRFTVKEYNIGKAAAANQGSFKEVLHTKLYEPITYISSNGLPVRMVDVDLRGLQAWITHRVTSTRGDGDHIERLLDLTMADLAMPVTRPHCLPCPEQVEPQAQFSVSNRTIRNFLIGGCIPLVWWLTTWILIKTAKLFCNLVHGGMVNTITLPNERVRDFQPEIFEPFTAAYWVGRDRGTLRSTQWYDRNPYLPSWFQYWFYILITYPLYRYDEVGLGCLIDIQHLWLRSFIQAALSFTWVRSGVAGILARGFRRFGGIPALGRLVLARLDVQSRLVVFQHAYGVVKSHRWRKIIRDGIFAGFSLAAVYKICHLVKGMCHCYDTVKSESTINPDGTVNLDEPGVDNFFKARDIYAGRNNGNNNDTALRRGAVQARDPCMSLEHVYSKVSANLFKIRVTPVDSPDINIADQLPDTKVAVQYGTLLGGRTSGALGLVNEHLFDKSTDYYLAEIFWREDHVIKPFILYKNRISFGSDLSGVSRDACVFTIPDTGSVPSIMDLFPLQSIAASTALEGRPIKRVVCRQISTDLYSHTKSLNLVPSEFCNVQAIKYNQGHTSGHIFSSLCTFGQGSKGSCGLPVLMDKCFIGVHSGANNVDKVYTTYLDIRYLRDLVGGLDTLESSIRVPVIPTIGKPIVTDGDNTSSRAFGKTMEDTAEVHSESSLKLIRNNAKFSMLGSFGNLGIKFRSEYKSSPVYEKLKAHIPITRDIRAGFNTPIPLFRLTVDKIVDVASPPTCVEHDSLRVATLDVRNFLQKRLLELATGDNAFMLQLHPASMTTVLDGIGVPLAGPINIDTSAGYLPGKKHRYMSKVYSAQTDKHHIGFDIENEVSMDILQMAEDIETRCADGVTPSYFCNTVPKDEVLEVKGVDENGKPFTKPPRPINCVDTAVLLVYRKYFMPLLAIIGQDPMGFGHFVGVDPMKGFGEMFTRLGSPDDVNYLATDYSKFDLSSSVFAVEAAVDILIDLTRNLKGYTDEHRRIMKILCYDICNPIYDLSGVIVRFTGTNSSGNPLTTMINCLVNHLTWNQMWLMWDHERLNPGCKSYGGIGTRHRVFYDHCTLIVLGDDCVGSVPKSEGFDQLIAVRLAAKLGYTLTSSDKGSEVTPYSRGFAFLKRHMDVYQLSNGKDLVLAPLSLTSIFKPFVWGTWKTELLEHYAGLIKGALYELAQHGPDVYDEYVLHLTAFIDSVTSSYQSKGEAMVETLSDHFADYTFKTWHETISELYRLGPDVSVLPGTPMRV